ncbi:MAG: dephospho-CoA kinase [Oceanicola sp.]|nr:dephospho-CoA kinase [Oceanicola sp.]
MSPYKVGLTGSIGMGKSTTAALFAAHDDVAVWDADAAVHRLYAAGGAAVAPIAALCPAALGPDGIDRSALKEWIAQDPTAIRQIESIVHPLVADDRATFLNETSARIVILDIPLLFETGGDAQMDLTVVVSTDAATQKSRVLQRPGMTEAQFERIVSLQMADAEKRQRADAIVDTSSMEAARRDVAAVLSRIREQIDA